MKKQGLAGDVFLVKNIAEIERVDAVVIPGGESSTILRVLHEVKADGVLRKKIVEDNLPVMGTCAGCVLLAKKITGEKKDKINSLKAMSMTVERNAFGRQRESFEQDVIIDIFQRPYHAVFIRAPVIRETWDECKPLAKIDDKIVMAQQGKMLALSFHPELTEDIRIHEYFLKQIE